MLFALCGGAAEYMPFRKVVSNRVRGKRIAGWLRVAGRCGVSSAERQYRSSAEGERLTLRVFLPGLAAAWNRWAYLKLKHRNQSPGCLWPSTA